MHIDCDICVADGTEACDDCIVTFILHPGRALDLDDEEVEALELLAEEGLVPRLRLTIAPDPLSETG